MNKFWNFVKNEEGKRQLFFSGVIAEESWYDDDITPNIFKEELFSDTGDIEIWLNSPGGDCIAASRIYAMLMDYKGDITIKIDGIAASAASVIAMAGTSVQMAPTALMMIHNPFTVAIGDSEEMKKTIDMLSEVKESIINAYEIKTGLNRNDISRLMDAETWMNSNKAIEMGFADLVMEDGKRKNIASNFVFSRRGVSNSLLQKMKVRNADRTNIETLKKRLNLLRR
ncbi:head maturation protease, ClpP-related [Miniphocaeibacter massiliensis]|uniref:head maturation protease, ClpP-related n=1 Tax=Miniphocaeibacter massiliensis TaxID=2041841 RepID=UPI000C1C5982|nr:head maturation protease, ClpP-related [Miniphocaeibacter massiliensis]